MIKKFIVLAIVLVSVFAVTAQSKALAVTNPITSPITFFSLMGKVTYRNVFRTHTVTPAAGVKITAEKLGTSTKAMGTTNPDGTYGMSLTPGTYLIEASDTKRTFFTPAIQIVRISAGKSATRNFQGLTFIW